MNYLGRVKEKNKAHMNALWEIVTDLREVVTEAKETKGMNKIHLRDAIDWLDDTEELALKLRARLLRMPNALSEAFGPVESSVVAAAAQRLATTAKKDKKAKDAAPERAPRSAADLKRLMKGLDNAIDHHQGSEGTTMFSVNNKTGMGQLSRAAQKNLKHPGVPQSLLDAQDNALDMIEYYSPHHPKIQNAIRKLLKEHDKFAETFEA